MSFEGLCEDSLIKTKEGYKQIKEIKNGDLVQIYDETYQPVIDTMKNFIETDVRKISSYTNEIKSIRCTDNFKFLVSKQDIYSRQFSKFDYVSAKDIDGKSEEKMGDYTCFSENHIIGMFKNEVEHYSGFVYKLFFDKDYSYVTLLGIVKN